MFFGSHLPKALRGGSMALTAAIAAIALHGTQAQAQGSWPTQTVKVVVGFPAGSSPDMVARFVAEPLAKALGQSVIVENKPGAGGNIGVDAVARATDDHTFGFTTNGPLTTSPALYRKLSYDVDKDLRPLSLAAVSGQVLVIDPKLPVQTVPEFLAFAKAQKGGVSYGSVGVGSGSHLTAELFAAQTDTPILHVPFQGFGQVTTAIIGSTIQAAFMAPSGAIAQAKAGKLRVLAITSSKASASAPGVPTVAESARLPNFQAELWIGTIAPKSMPDAIAARLTAEIQKILHSAEVREKLAQQGWDAIGSTPQEMQARVNADTRMWGEVIKRAKIQID